MSKSNKNFDKTDFLFETDIEVMVQCLKERLEELNELYEIQYKSGAEKKRQEELIYWIGIAQRDIPEAKRRGMVKVPLCAVESAVLNIPRKKKTKKRG